MRFQIVMAILGHPVDLTETLRLRARQATLYALGRTTPGPCATRENPMGLTVTNAKPGESGHEPDEGGLSRAFDFHFRRSPSWGEDQPWDLAGTVVKALGARWGGDWTHWAGGKGDRPHVYV